MSRGDRTRYTGTFSADTHALMVGIILNHVKRVRPGPLSRRDQALLHALRNMRPEERRPPPRGGDYLQAYDVDNNIGTRAFREPRGRVVLQALVQHGKTWVPTPGDFHIIEPHAFEALLKLLRYELHQRRRRHVATQRR